MKLVSIQLGLPRKLGTEGAADPMDQPWETGFFKTPVPGPIQVTRTNLVGDGQADLVNHGGLDKAVLAYSADHYSKWSAELGIDMPLGAFGENLSITDLDEESVCLGDSYRIGTAVFQVSQPRQPCWKLGRRWRMKDLPQKVINNLRSGWYFRVLQEGTIEAGQDVIRTARPNPDWPIARCSRIWYQPRGNHDQRIALSQIRELAEAWSVHLARG